MYGLSFTGVLPRMTSSQLQLQNCLLVYFQSECFVNGQFVQIKNKDSFQEQPKQVKRFDSLTVVRFSTELCHFIKHL